MSLNERLATDFVKFGKKSAPKKRKPKKKIPDQVIIG